MPGSTGSASLNQMVGSVEPRPIVWENIQAPRSAIPAPQAPLALPEAPPPPSAGDAEPRRLPRSAFGRADNSNVIQLSGRVRRWRNIASFATALAAALIAMLAAAGLSAGSVARGLRPKPRTQMVEVKTPALPAPPSAQYVALLQRDGGSPAFILTVDAATKNFTVRKVGAERRSPARVLSCG